VKRDEDTVLLIEDKLHIELERKFVRSTLCFYCETATPLADDLYAHHPSRRVAI